MKWITESADQTQELGRKLGQCLQSGDRVLLFGTLGAGKTTLTQGLANGLGMAKGEYVRSPTFTLVNEYQGRHSIFHIDLYRLTGPADIESLGLEDVLDQPGVVIVEWAEKLFLPTCEGDTNPILDIGPHFKIHLEILSDTSRKLLVESVEMPSESHPIFSLQ